MSDYSEMSLEELEAELKKQESILEDIQTERSFLGKQVGMHINASEFTRLDRDAERTEERISSLKAAIEPKR